MADDGTEKSPLIKSNRNNTLHDSDEDISSCGASVCCDPKRNVHRYFVLGLICFLSFGSYYCYDNPAALENIIKQDMRVKTDKYVMLYSLYSYPNVILCFFGGFLLDRVFGVRLGTIIFSLFVLVGQVIFALGAYYHSFLVMEIGRFVFGLGGENLAVAQNTYSVNWFKGKELNMVFGLQLSFSRVGSTINMNVNNPIYDAFGKPIPADESYKALGLTLFVGEVIRLSDVKDFPLTLWLIFIICVAYYVAIFPFIALGLAFFQAKFDIDPQRAGAVNSVVFIISACASPFLGFMVDKVGKNVLWVIISVAMTLGCHCMLAFTFWEPFVAMSIMGIAYSLLACALWPLVALVVPETQLGTAYGFMQSIQNLGLAVISQVAGIIVDEKGYLVLEVFFSSGKGISQQKMPSEFVEFATLCLVHFALITSILLYLVDASKGSGLNLSTMERKLLAAEGSATKISSEDESLGKEDTSPIVPRSAAQLRLRFLSRVGQEYFQLPETYRASALAYPHVLK
ncbi:Major facilitator superfamily domain-containing protein 1 [Acropora cervicornis]|uniref:Lysosomal dipeptide transporter MFSD1 n=1 Tax=Acropora cervicornis TaxID=6130 RepID=A0AAD9R632_ACRCE|nr:Major facilitator superfamily domain-containing protein 1 [Acropora cervicornis]